MNLATPNLTCPANHFRVRVLMLTGLLAFAVVASADTLHLLGGERLIGKIIKDEGEEIVIESQALGRLKVPRDRVERVELDPPPVVSPVKQGPAQPFAPLPPVSAQPALTLTNPPVTTFPSTNAPPKHRWFWPFQGPGENKSTDWIQLKSGEWLRGRLYGMQNRKLEFESDELNDLEMDWKDVHQVIAPRALVSYGERESTWGSVRVDREKVTVTGAEEVTFPRYDLVGIAPGSPRELDYWSGKFNVGLNVRSGNTEQTDFVTKMKLERRTPRNHLKLEYTGNFSELNGVESVNNQRVSELFDYFFTRRWFLRLPQAEYYQDPFQNIGRRITISGGTGYYLIDQPKAEWLIAAGPAYQKIRFDSVEAGSSEDRSTPAFALQSTFDIQLTKRIDLELDYQGIAANQDSGGMTHHATATIEIDLTRRLELDLSFIWDYIGNPQADSSGAVPKNNDFRMNLSLGVKF